MLARCHQIAGVLLVGAMLVTTPARAAENDADLGIEVDDKQLVTMSTQTASLATVVRQLCEKAGVTMRGYEAPDRPVAAAYEGVPLRDVLQRLLRDETYMIGVRAGDEPSDIEVAWLHVTASKLLGHTSAPVPMAADGQPVPSPAAGALSVAGLAPEVVLNALTSSDDAKRRAATIALADHVDSNPGALDGFLAKDTAEAISGLLPYDYADEALHALALRQKNSVNRATLDAIVKSLRLQRGATAKKPSYVDLMQQGMPH
jgi:hypothetical protein